MNRETLLNDPGDAMYSDQIRAIVAAHGRLQADIATLDDDADLYEAGLTSLSTVNLMLALEEAFDVEFLDRMLKRRTFQSIRSLSEAVAELLGASVAAAAQPAPAQQELRGAA
jgi:acyl carrier protein